MGNYEYTYITKDKMSFEYLNSNDYVNDFLLYKDQHKNYNSYMNFKDDAQLKTDNYSYRHFKMNTLLGTWRWKGMFTYKDKILPIIFNKNLKGVDFGGAQCPVSRDIDIVDIDNKDIWGRPIKYKNLKDINYKLDYIFSSHCLEHLPELSKFIEQFYNSLKDNGKLILNLPAYTCKRWRGKNGHWMGGTPHLYTFALEETKIEEEIDTLVLIDTILKIYNFKINIAEYTGDNSIIIIAEK